MPPGFLIVFSEPGEQVPLDEYHGDPNGRLLLQHPDRDIAIDWYNNEHIPIRLNHLSSFLTGARFTASDGSKPSWVALYDVDDTATFKHESYTSLRANRSAREKDVIQRLEVLDRRTCELVFDSGESPLTSSLKVINPTKTIITHGINSESSDDQDLRPWATKLCQSMEQAEGWVRTRTFKCIDNLRTGYQSVKHGRANRSKIHCRSCFIHFTNIWASATGSAQQTTDAIHSGSPASPTSVSLLLTTDSITPHTTGVTPAAPTASFPPIGSVPRDFSPDGLAKLWDVVGPVEAPPFTTTRIPNTPIVLPSPPPALYPSWFAPSPQDIFPALKLPKGFKFGVATAAYQVEGAVKNEGKGPTMWDWNSRQPGGVVDNTTADIVDLQYYLYKEDVARVAALGVNAHSFSVSWARIFPFGTADSPVNQAGLKHYSDLIDYHIQSGVEPVLTLFHWDTPLALQAYYGGFTSPKIVDDFVNYAKTVFKAYNGRIKTWYSLSSIRHIAPLIQLRLDVSLAPGVNSSTAPYQCAYNLRAHSGAVKAFREMKIQGEIAFKNDDFVGIPWRMNTTDDTAAVERHASFRIGSFSDPVYKTGDWPKLMTDTLPPSYLPRFTEEERKDLLGSADFFAIDAYRTQFISAPLDGLASCVSNTSHPLWPECHTVVLFDSNAGWAAGPSPDPLSDDWLQATPNTLRESLRALQTRWPTKKMYISEFGFVEPFESARTELFRITEDVTRTNYFMTYLGEILQSIHTDGIPIAGTFSWAMLDNAEWNSGLSARFGIQYVNYTTLERVYKRSAISLSQFFKAHLQN
ncbi:glycoside hydrolase superfamily [Infundibulicybe gibba]|nr:glycoside hydrolase superfamily [Infundibulicybe gibba]